MKIARRIRRSKWFKKFIAACLISGMAGFGFVPAAWALPQGGNVVNLPGLGTATIGNSDLNNVLVNVNGKGVIINWNSFSIKNGESTTFNFDTANAAALNRVITNNPSLISGLLEATNNGKVILVNPNGIVFGDGAQINVPCFVASTIDISDTNFQNYINGDTNKLIFDQNTNPNSSIYFDTGSIKTNEQFILLAPQITIAPGVTLYTPSFYGEGRGGQINLLAGQKATFGISNDTVDISNFQTDTSNSVKINANTDGSSIYANGMSSGITIIGGKIEAEDSLLSADTLILLAASSVSEYANKGKIINMIANPDNSVNLTNNVIGGQDTTIIGGGINITGDMIQAYNLELYAAKSLNRTINPENLVTLNATADTDNKLTITNDVIMPAMLSGVDILRGMGGEISISGNKTYNTRVDSGNIIDLAAFKEIKYTQSKDFPDSLSVGETDFKSESGNKVTLNEGALITGLGVNIWGNSMEINSGITGYYPTINAANSIVNSQKNNSYISTHDANNILKIGSTGNITAKNVSDDLPGSISLLGYVIENNGKLLLPLGKNANDVYMIALGEVKDNGQIMGGNVRFIKFSGKDARPNEEYEENGISINTKKTPLTTIDVNGDTVKIYGKDQPTPSPTPPGEIEKAIDNALNMGNKSDTLAEIQNIFNQIKDQPLDTKKEAVKYLFGEIEDESDGYKEEVAQAIIDGNGGRGRFNRNLSEANNETSKENNVQQQSGETNINETTQLTQNNDQTVSNNAASSDVLLEGEEI